MENIRKSHRKGLTLEQEYGEKRASEIKKRSSESHKGKQSFNKGKPHLAFEKNPLWKGGSIDSIKRQCLIRDDFICKICGLRDVEIAQVDHIIKKSEKPELYLELSNLQTLCPNCHARKTQQDYGNKRYYKHVWRQRYK